MRFFATCVILAAACVAGVLYLSQFLGTTTAEQQPPGRKSEATRPPRPDEGREAEAAPPPRPASAGVDDQKARVVKLTTAQPGAQPIIIPEGRVVATETQNVPSERDGKLVLLATPVGPEEEVPAHLLIKREVPVLATRITEDEWRRQPSETRLAPVFIPEDKVLGRPAERTYYRPAKTTDTMAPGTTLIVRHTQHFRRLNEGDIVRSGQVLGVINPTLALEELAIKQAKVEAADAEVRAAGSIKEESKRRLKSANQANATVGGRAVSRDEIGTLEVQVDRYINEEVAKKSALVQARKELAGSLATFELYKLTAAIDGRVKTIFKNQGDAVKNLEPVLQIQSPWKLRVEAQMDVADAQPLRRRLDEARAHRADAQRLIADARAQGTRAIPERAQKLLTLASDLVAVTIEASRPVPPQAVLAGHLKDVTCVAVSKGALPRVVSGSLDHTARVWEQQPGGRWQATRRIDHGAAVRAVACTGPAARANLLLTATAAGRARVFDLDNLDKDETVLDARHAGGINAVAFNAEGTRCATAGEDRYIRLFNPANGQLLASKSGAHQAAITSLAFTPQGQLVSAGRDKRLVVWDVKDDNQLAEADALPGRSGEVTQLGVSPDGKHVLFDEGRELRVLSLDGRKIEGSLTNAGGASDFATMALFSPDGHAVLTNGNGPGRVQLWRAPVAGKRPAELRQYLWANGTATCGAFAPRGDFAVTGTSDHRVLVWGMPEKGESERLLEGELTYVESFLDTSLRRVTVRASFDNPVTPASPDGLIIPGGAATIVVKTPAK